MAAENIDRRGGSAAACQLAKRERLRINEIFYSLQGEADAVGYPTVFVRLTGCPLRCQYCDTEYAFHAGEWWDRSPWRRCAGFGARMCASPAGSRWRSRIAWRC
jgi:hypothetical protein